MYEDQTLDLDADLIDCENEEIVWSIAQYAGGNGQFATIDANTGVITPDSSKTNEGCRIAVRASLKSDPDIYDLIIVEYHIRN